MTFFAFSDPDPRLCAQVLASLGADGRPAVMRGDWVVSASTPDEPAGLFVTETDRALSPAVRREVIQTIERDPGLGSLGRLLENVGFAYIAARSAPVFVRAPVGLVPFYVFEGKGQRACSTSLTWLARYLPAPLGIEPLVVAIFSSLFGWFPQRRTFLHGVRALSFGEAAVARAHEFRIFRWWDPTWLPLPSTSPAKARAHADALREALLTTLRRHVPEDGSGVFTLSGGLDSSALVALSLSSLSRQINTLSFIPAHEPFRTRVRQGIEECLAVSPSQVSRRWCFEHSLTARLAYVTSAPHVVYPVLNPALCVLPALRRDARLTTLIGGEFADDFFGSHLTYEDLDLVLAGLGAVRHFRRVPGGVRGLLEHGRRLRRHRTDRARLLRPEALPAFCRPTHAAEYAAMLQDERRSLAQDPRPRVYLAKRFEALQTAVAQNAEVLGSLGMVRVFPFFTRATVELAFSSHPFESMGPGTKGLIRAGLAGRVPTAVLRRGKDHWPEPSSPARIETPRIPPEAARVLCEDWMETPPATLGVLDSLRLRLVLNIVSELSNARNGGACDN